MTKGLLPSLKVFGMALALLAPTLAAAQSGDGKKNSKPQAASPSKAAQKPTLEEVTRVSTTQAIRDAAKNTSTKRATVDAKDAPQASEVLEFRPAPDSGDSAEHKTVATSKNSKKSALKNVHGTVYGSLAPADSRTRSAGASTGVSSKSGKTSVYVETERSRTASPK